MLCSGCQVSLAASRLHFLKFSSIGCKINIRKFGGKPYKHALGGGGGRQADCRERSDVCVLQILGEGGRIYTVTLTSWIQ